MSELLQKQFKFTEMLGELILYAYRNGFTLTLGEGFVSSGTGHMKGSLHYIRLAQDLNIFKDGVWLQDGTGLDVLHDFWDSLGGAKRIEKDLNHFSVEWAGKR